MQRNAPLRSLQCLKRQLSVRPSSLDFRLAHGADSTTLLQPGVHFAPWNLRDLQTENVGHRQSSAQAVGMPTFQHSTSK